MATVVDTAAAMIEQVRPLLQSIYDDSEISDQISALFKKNDKEIKNITRYLYRIPLLKYMGGNHHKYSANGGSLGTGTGMSVTNLTAGYIYTARIYRVTDEQVDLSQNTKQSVVDVMAKTLSDGMKAMQMDDDIALHGDGTGTLTNSSSATNGTTTLTFAGATDTLNTSKLKEGMVVDIWDSTLATKRAPSSGTAPTTIVAIDWSSYVVTLSQTIASLTQGDVLTVAGLDSYGPSTLVTAQSGWPATSALTTDGGLGGDSYRHGIYYAHDSTTSNYYLGKLKSTIPQIVPTRINGNAQSLTFAHVLLGQDKIRKRRDPDAVKGLIGIAPMAQRAQIFDIGTAISTRMLTSDKFGKSLDLMPENTGFTETFDIAGITTYVSKRQPNDRVDFCNPKNWGRAEVFPTRPYTVGGKTVFEGREGSTGAVVAFQEFAFQSAYDFVCYDPGAEFYINNILIPSGY